MGRTISIGILVLAILDLVLSCFCVSMAQRIYPFAIPFVVSLGLWALVGVIAVIKNQRLTRVVQTSFAPLSLFLFVLAFINWPSGDDGPKMFLVVLIGPLTLWGVIFAFISASDEDKSE